MKSRKLLRKNRDDLCEREVKYEKRTGNSIWLTSNSRLHTMTLNSITLYNRLRKSSQVCWIEDLIKSKTSIKRKEKLYLNSEEKMCRQWGTLLLPIVGDLSR